MTALRKKFKQSKILQTLSSLKITVVCLFLLFVLTFWGTVAQTHTGLYNAQQRYFFSLFFLIGGIIPFPGAKLVLGILFINLSAATLTRFTWERSKLGILMIHSGLLLYLISALIVYTGTVESNVTLMEGDGTNVSSAYHSWELSVWEKAADVQPRNIVAVDAAQLKAGRQIGFPNLKATVLHYYPNSDAYTTDDKLEEQTLNASGIKVIKEIPTANEPEKNFPGGIFEFTTLEGKKFNVLLYGAEIEPTQLQSGGKTYNVQLRRKRYALPFVLVLKDFRMTVYPNTQLASSYESLIEITNHDVTREVLISMNNPLRYKNFTVYQASYSIDRLGRELSTLAVVKNVGWTLPYISSGITFAGLVLHFLMMAFTRRTRKHKTV